jgi:hypothetical protein
MHEPDNAQCPALFPVSSECHGEGEYSLGTQKRLFRDGERARVVRQESTEKEVADGGFGQVHNC